MKRILITGGTGYLGARIVQKLCSNKNYEIYIGSRSNDSCSLVFPDLHWRYLNLSDDESIKKCCHNIDIIIHLAALNEKECSEDELAAYSINSLGTKKIIDYAVQSSVERIIYFSTAHVYGAPFSGVINEDTIPYPVHPYSISHLVAEYYLLDAHKKHLIEGVIVRLSNSFGSPLHKEISRWSLLVNEICRQAVETGEIRLKSNGEQKRDFITICDVELAVDHLMELKLDSIVKPIFNLGGDYILSINEMAVLVQRRYKILTDTDVPIYRNENDQRSYPDFEYSSQKIKQSGLKIRKSITSEIDNTLKVCLNWFGKDSYD